VYVTPDTGIDAQVIEIHERFCSSFASRDAEAVMGLFGPDPDVAVVTSEQALLRGPIELRDFLERYVEGSTTYSWEWERRDVSAAGSVAWLLAEGTEIAASSGGLERHPYRMTMVLERRAGGWLLMQVHGSSPQH
jgi:ketosteroid isomerase-like protein